MQINTKFNLGEYAYYLEGLYIHQSRVLNISVQVLSNSTTIIEYHLEGKKSNFREEVLFKTKEELINAIQ